MSTQRYKRYPAYRVSGVEWIGEIPAGWEMKRLRYVAELNPSPSIARSLPIDTEISFVPMEAVGEYGGIDLTQTKSLADLGSGYTYFADGDVVFAKITPCFENGKGAVAMALVNGVAFGTTELHVLRCFDVVLTRYVFYVTISHAFRRLGQAEMYGAGGQKRVPEAFVENLKHAIPPVPEQRAIAAFLDRETARIDTLVAKKERLIELLQERRTSLITHAVTKGLDPKAPMQDSGVEWIGEIPAHWEIAPLYARYRVELGKMLDTKRITGKHLHPYLRNIDVQWDKVNIENLPEMDFPPSDRDRYTLQPGDLLVCEGGEVGRTALWRGELPECYYQKAIHRLRPRFDSDSPRFLYYVIRMAADCDVFGSVGNQNTIDHLTAVQLRRYRFPFAPPHEQTAIASFLDGETARIDALAAKVREAVDRLKEYRTALISAAVTGKIDVREEVE